MDEEWVWMRSLPLETFIEAFTVGRCINDMTRRVSTH